MFAIIHFYFQARETPVLEQGTIQSVTGTMADPQLRQGVQEMDIPSGEVIANNAITPRDRLASNATNCYSE